MSGYIDNLPRLQDLKINNINNYNWMYNRVTCPPVSYIPPGRHEMVTDSVFVRQLAKLEKVLIEIVWLKESLQITVDFYQQIVMISCSF